MAPKRSKKFALALIGCGVAICAASPWIVTPGLERLLGIETIVGSQNVSYKPDGTYVYTNPVAVVKWIGATCLFGIVVTSVGAAQLLTANLRQRKPRNCSRLVSDSN